MNPIESILSAPFGQALGWTLLHFVWQGTLIAFVLAAALHALRRHAAHVRYAVACGALALLLVIPAITLYLYAGANTETPADRPAGAASVTPASPAATAPALRPAASPETPATWQQEANGLLRVALPWLVMLWMMGVLALSVRYLAGWTYTSVMRRRRIREVGRRWQEQVARLSEQMGVRQAVRLVSSALVQVPTVIGWLRPVILMPVSVFAGLTPRQVELILAHELAHIRRHDYLVNLMQAVCETLLFYHPAAWWVSGRVRIEREHGCDDLVVSVCGDAYTYAEALARLEHVRQGTPRLALAASGGSLLDRIRRLLEEPAEAPPRTARWVTGLALVSMFALSLYLSPALRGLWTQTQTRVAGTQADEALKPGGLLLITLNDDRGVLLEDFEEDGIVNTAILKGPHIKVQMRAGSRLVVDDLDGPSPQGRVDPEANTMTFTGHLALEIWHQERRESRLVVEDGTVVYGQSGVHARAERITVRRTPFESTFSARRPPAQAGYETTAALLEDLIFKENRTSTQLEALDELRALPKLASLPSLINIATKHPNARTRHEAVQWVGRMGDAYVVPALEQVAFEDQSEGVQMEALDALRNLPDKIGIPSLIKLARTHPRAAMRSEAVQWLGRLGDADARPTLVQVLFEEADASVQRDALDALVSLPRGISTNLLEQISQTHPNEDVRREAMQRLVGARDSRMRRNAAEMQMQRRTLNPITVNARRIPDSYASTAVKLERLVFEDDDPSVQREAFDALRNMTGGAIKASLVRIAQTHPNEALRAQAVDRLKEVDREAAVAERMRAAVDVSRNHPEADQRAEAVQSLQDWQSREFFTVLTDIAFTDPSREVQEEALDAIRDRGGLESWARLARIAREHPNAGMRSEAVQSLDGLNSDDLLDVLEEILLSDPSLDVRMEALDLLVEQPKARSLPLLRTIARHPTLPEALRNAAADELEDLR